MTSKIKFIVLFLFCPTFFFGQIHISENIQDSKIANNTESKLFFIDFWATWCGPCITVSKYLSALQSQYPNDFYILSLSQENPETVKKFMTRHKIDLTVAIDFEGETFNKYGVTSLPYGVLINAYGVKIWEGHPAELKGYQIEGFIRKNTKKAYLKDIAKYDAYRKISNNSNLESIPKKDFQYIKLPDTDIDELQIIKQATYLELKGSLNQILSYINLVNVNQIKLDSNSNDVYKMTFKYDSSAYTKIKKTIYRALKLKESYTETKGEVIVFNIDNATFWDNNQINWGDETPNFLVGESDIKADNVSINDIKYKLSSLLNTPILIENSKSHIDKNSSNDWDIHYKYFDLMASNFLDNYGINVEKKMMVYPMYTIIKKTP